jgi:RNA polymerase sigma-70 factor (ECF subfamily)
MPETRDFFQTMTQRGAEQWLDSLRGAEPSSDVQQELLRYLRAGLARVLKNREVRDGDLDDFAQEAMVRIFQNLDTFRGDSRFTTWAMAVAVRVAFSELRRQRSRPLSLDTLAEPLDRPFSEPASAVEAPLHSLERNDLLESLRRAIQERLSARQRTAIFAELAGIPSSEIARQLNTNSNALYKLNHDARKKLKLALQEAGFDEQDVREALSGASRTA